MPVVLDRFLRVVGGQVLAAAVVGSISFINGGGLGVEFSAYAVVLGSLLTAADKWCRDKKYY